MARIEMAAVEIAVATTVTWHLTVVSPGRRPVVQPSHARSSTAHFLL